MSCPPRSLFRFTVLLHWRGTLHTRTVSATDPASARSIAVARWSADHNATPDQVGVMPVRCGGSLVVGA